MEEKEKECTTECKRKRRLDQTAPWALNYESEEGRDNERGARRRQQVFYRGLQQLHRGHCPGANPSTNPFSNGAITLTPVTSSTRPTYIQSAQFGPNDLTIPTVSTATTAITTTTTPSLDTRKPLADTTEPMGVTSRAVADALQHPQSKPWHVSRACTTRA